jgi:hypothetical protein
MAVVSAAITTSANKLLLKTLCNFNSLQTRVRLSRGGMEEANDRQGRLLRAPRATRPPPRTPSSVMNSRRFN